ncbi:hypothetical protein Gotur_010067, partial [Gossypium turneri]
MAAKRKTPVKTRNLDLIRGVGKYSRSKKPLLNKRKPKPTKLRLKDEHQKTKMELEEYKSKIVIMGNEIQQLKRKLEAQ